MNAHNRNFDKDKKSEYLKNALKEMPQYNQVVCGDFNQENLTFNNLTRITNNAEYTWKKSENSTYATKSIDYLFASMPAAGAYEDTESNHRAIYATISLSDIKS